MVDRLDSDNRLLRKIAEVLEAGAGIPPAVQAALDLKEDAANKSNEQSMNDNSAVLFPTQQAVKSRIEGFTAISYDTPTVLDFDELPYQSVELSGNLTLEGTNYSAAKSVTLLIIGDGSIRNLSFPSGWKFFGGAAPTTLAANKQALLTLTAFGSTEGTVKAAYAAEP